VAESTKKAMSKQKELSVADETCAGARRQLTGVRRVTCVCSEPYTTVIDIPSSSVDIVTRLDDKGIVIRFPAFPRDFIFPTASRMSVGSTQPPTQWVPGIKRPEHEADRSLHQVPRLRRLEAVPPLPHTSSWRGA
jgi:hypothetical protein